jgi:hypothetical protein
MNTNVYDGFLPYYYHGIRAGTPSGPRAVSLWCPRVAFPRSAQDPLKTRSSPARYPQIIRAEAHPRVTRSLSAHYPLRTRLRPARYSDSVRAEALKSDFHTTSTNPAKFDAVIRVIITVTTAANATGSTTSTAATTAAVATTNTNINITTSGITTNGGKRPTSVFHFFTAKSLL